jgi:hypothetical protein
MHIKNDWRKDFTKAFNHSIGHGSFGKSFFEFCFNLINLSRFSKDLKEGVA